MTDFDAIECSRCAGSGERSMRKRAAALVEAHSDLPATTKINVIKAGFARRLTVSILALPTGEK